MLGCWLCPIPLVEEYLPEISHKGHNKHMEYAHHRDKWVTALHLQTAAVNLLHMQQTNFFP